MLALWPCTSARSTSGATRCGAAWGQAGRVEVGPPRRLPPPGCRSAGASRKAWRQRLPPPPGLLPGPQARRCAAATIRAARPASSSSSVPRSTPAARCAGPRSTPVPRTAWRHLPPRPAPLAAPPRGPGTPCRYSPTLTKRRLYFMRLQARPVAFFFLSCFATLGVWPRTLPARASEPWTLPALACSHVHTGAWGSAAARAGVGGAGCTLRCGDRQAAAGEPRGRGRTHGC